MPHARHGKLHHLNCCEDIQLKHTAHLGHVRPPRWGRETDTGVVDQDIDAAEARKSLGYRALARRRIQQIGAYDKISGSRVSFESCAPPGYQRNPGATAAKFLDACRSNALGCSSNQGDGAVNPHETIRPLRRGNDNGSMQQELLPLFPLSLVLLPGAPLPLHIFEDRYKEMIGGILNGGGEFGVVLATEQGIANTGCTAQILQVLKKYDDGRMDIVTAGRRRFEIVHLNEERSFLRGEVMFFADEAGDEASLALRRRVADLGNSVSEEARFEPEGSDLSFSIGQLISDVETRQILLSLRSERERLELLEKYLPQHMAKKELSAKMRRLALRNGRGDHLKGE